MVVYDFYYIEKKSNEIDSYDLVKNSQIYTIVDDSRHDLMDDLNKDAIKIKTQKML